MKNQDFRNALFAEQAAGSKGKGSKTPISGASLRQAQYGKRLHDDSSDESSSKKQSRGARHIDEAVTKSSPPKCKDDNKEAAREEYIDRAELRRQMEKELLAKQSVADGAKADVITFSQLLGGGSTVLTAEERQMLGGDEEHTYLVSGLDARLLEKARAEIKAKEEEAKRLALLNAKNKVSEDKGSKSLWAQALVNDFSQSLNIHNVKFRKQLALIYKHISRGGRFKGNTAVFNRMYYLFDSQTPQPAILFRSAASTLDPDFNERILLNSVTVLPDTLLTRIDAVCAAHRRSFTSAAVSRNSTIDAAMTDTVDGQLRSQNQEEMEATQEDDFEIFPDAGTLDITELVQKALQERTEADREEQERRRAVARQLKEQERQAMKAAETLMTSAATILEEAEAMEMKEVAARKRLLERPPDEPLDDNPFSLKNASLLPLINKKPKLGGVDFKTHGDYRTFNDKGPLIARN